MQIVSVNGIRIYPFESMTELIDYVVDKRKILIAINAGKIGRVDDDFRGLVSKNIGYADGIGALAAIKKVGFKTASKIPGCDIWLKIIEHEYKKKALFYFVGGKQEVIEDVITRLRRDYPGIVIVGHRNGYIESQEEESALIQDIVDKKPDYVFVAMGSPKQEILMKRMYSYHRALYQGLGGSFDVYAGRIKRTPQWLINVGFDGPYRVITSFSRSRWRRFWSDLKIMLNIMIGSYPIEIIEE